MKTGHLGPEQTVHGFAWGHVHGGYFSDPEVARPLVAAIRAEWTQVRPDRIVDLGGGTGFLLSQLRAAGIGQATALVDLDGSAAQLALAQQTGITCVNGSVDRFRRDEVVPPGHRVIWMMRSVLHYAGKEGLTPLLEHLRTQMETGESWVHQTACFERQENADCLNAIYHKMRTGKWYPTVADLRTRLEATGWQVKSVLPAPVLHLEASELAQRYGVDVTDLSHIRKEMAAEWGEQNEALRMKPGEFQTDLHYRIFVCQAAG